MDASDEIRKKLESIGWIIISCINGIVYFVSKKKNNKTINIHSKEAHKLILLTGKDLGLSKRLNLACTLSDFEAMALCNDETITTYYRVAPAPGGGIFIDLGDRGQTRLKVSETGVESISVGCPVHFIRNTSMRPLVEPTSFGRINPLFSYLNLENITAWLLIGWITYTLAHPKVNTSKFVILVLRGEQGSGKSFLCRLIRELIDPSSIVLQALPKKVQDLAIASENSHVVILDNLRSISKSTSDHLCMLATGGMLSNRKLYTNAEQSIQSLHGPLCITTLHPCIEESDLADRCMNLTLAPISKNDRRSEYKILENFEGELPIIFKGVLNLISGVFKNLPNVNVSHPERMLDFCYWLAALEAAAELEEGVLQKAYSQNVRDGLRDCLQNNNLADAVLRFAESQEKLWCGTPSELLEALNNFISMESTRDRYWPSNPIALSKRLIGMKPALNKQGVTLYFSRGKERQIEIGRAPQNCPIEASDSTEATNVFALKPDAGHCPLPPTIKKENK